MDKKLLSILCCPITRKGLSPARKDLLAAVNAAIDAGKLQNHDGDVLNSALQEALVTDDGKTLYPIDDGIPVLLEGEAVSLDQLDAA
jgi:uncharacterized protein YbaR (Trm112 family)